MPPRFLFGDHTRIKTYRIISGLFIILSVIFTGHFQYIRKTTLKPTPAFPYILIRRYLAATQHGICFMLDKLLVAMAKGMAVLPLPAALSVGRGLGWLYGSVIRYHRQDALESLARAFPETSESERRRILNDMYAGLGMNLIELTRLTSLNPEQLLSGYIQVEGEEHIRHALERKKGALILTGHIGSWDLLCTVTPRFGYPLTVITKKIKQESLNRLWLDIRERFGVQFLPSHNAYRQCLKALRNNELIGFILDQNMINTEGVFVDFFGKPACTSPGLAYMAAQAQAPIVPIFIKRQPDGSHVIHIQPAIEPPADREPDTIRDATQTYTRVLEEYIRKNPSDWIWIHRRWRTKPPVSTEST